MRRQDFTETEHEYEKPDDYRQESGDRPLFALDDADDAREKGGDAGNCCQQGRYGQRRIAEKRFPAELPGSCQYPQQGEKQDQPTRQSD